MKSRTVLSLLLASICHGAENGGKSWKHPEPITYEALQAWHKEGGLKAYHWPKAHRADLNGDGREEAFLGLSGYGRGMTYALFTKTKSGWILLSDEIDGSHHAFEALTKKPGTWSDFKGLTPSGRGGLHETIYTWDGKHYVQKSSREITAKELIGE